MCHVCVVVGRIYMRETKEMKLEKETYSCMAAMTVRGAMIQSKSPEA